MLLYRIPLLRGRSHVKCSDHDKKKIQNMFIFKCLNIAASKILHMCEMQDAVNILCAHHAARFSHFPRSP